MILFLFGGGREFICSCATGWGGVAALPGSPEGVRGCLQRYSNYSWGVRGQLEGTGWAAPEAVAVAAGKVARDPGLYLCYHAID